MASTDLTRTHTVATANERKKHTFSAWIKLSSTGSVSNTFFANRPSNTYRFYYMIQNSGASGANQFYCYMVYNGSAMLEATGTRKLRDVNGWYHIVVRTDTTQGTGADRFRVYINGEQETLTFGHTPDQDEELQVNRDAVHYIGEEGNGNGQFDGAMSHVHFCDGYSYAPTEFGETDSTTGMWTIKATPSVSYGTNGFFILKDGNNLSGSTVQDQSGQGNNFTASGTLTSLKDCPDNVFATLNPLDIGYTSNLSLANQNNTTNQTSNWGDYGIRSTLGATTGKYYWEAKITTNNTLCILPMETRLVINLSDGSPASDLYGVQRYGDTTTNIYDNTTFTQNSATMWGGITSSDIISFALDLTNGKLFLAKNGAYKNQSGATGDPVNGTNPTFTIADTSKTYGFYTEMRGNDNNGTIMNFGNGYFGTTAVTSAQNPDDGNGIFEYDVPAGYRALCTKSINAQEYS